jgi:hypothetical protein
LNKFKIKLNLIESNQIKLSKKMNEMNEWNGMEWNGMEWNGMEWNGMEWNGMEYV